MIKDGDKGPQVIQRVQRLHVTRYATEIQRRFTRKTGDDADEVSDFVSVTKNKRDKTRVFVLRRVIEAPKRKHALGHLIKSYSTKNRMQTTSCEYACIA